MFYGPYTGQHHGGDGGQMHKVRLYESDKIVKVTGRRGIGPGAGVDQLTFYTSRYSISWFQIAFGKLSDQVLKQRAYQGFFIVSNK